MVFNDSLTRFSKTHALEETAHLLESQNYKRLYCKPSMEHFKPSAWGQSAVNNGCVNAGCTNASCGPIF